MPQFFADTSFYYAVLDKRDPDHATATHYSQWLESRGYQLISTWEIIMETVTLLRVRYSFQAAQTFLNETFPSLQIFYLSPEDREASLKLFQKFSRDKKLSLCDIVSYHVITKHLKRIPYLGFDEDFANLGLTPFRLPE